MKTSTKKFAPIGSAFSEETWRAPKSSDWSNTGPDSLRAAEALRRKAYMRLAREVGISWLSCRRAAGVTK